MPLDWRGTPRGSPGLKSPSLFSLNSSDGEMFARKQLGMGSITTRRGSPGLKSPLQCSLNLPDGGKNARTQVQMMAKLSQTMNELAQRNNHTCRSAEQRILLN